jgi:hypothetical protein
MAAVSLALAAVAAGCNAVSSVLQRKANQEEPPDVPFGPRLLLHLLGRPVWLLGALSMIASFLLQAIALGYGTLSAVEPVLVVELPLTLILGAAVLHHPLPTRVWLSAAVMALGLGLFIGVLAPHGGDAGRISDGLAALSGAVTLGGIGLLVLAGQFGPDRSRAALFGAAGGSGFGLTASLMKIAVAKLSHGGPAGLFTAWETYAVVVVGVVSVVLVQAALHAGTLVAAQPGLTLLDPLVSLLWCTIVLNESTRTGPILFLAVAGAAVTVAAVLALARTTIPAYDDLGGRSRTTLAARESRA